MISFFGFICFRACGFAKNIGWIRVVFHVPWRILWARDCLPRKLPFSQHGDAVDSQRLPTSDIMSSMATTYTLWRSPRGAVAIFHNTNEGTPPPPLLPTFLRMRLCAPSVVDNTQPPAMPRFDHGGWGCGV